MAENKEKPREINGKLTREGMEQAINEGGSVMLPDGPPITRMEDLPSAAELAKGDAEQEKQVAAALDSQIAVLSAQRASLFNGTDFKADIKTDKK